MTPQAFEQARTRVRALRWFYVHVAVYVAVMSGVAIINSVTTPGHWWAIWPLVGWAIGLAAHAVAVFVWRSLLGAAWEERKIRELMTRGRQDP